MFDEFKILKFNLLSSVPSALAQSTHNTTKMFFQSDEQSGRKTTPYTDFFLYTLFCWINHPYFINLQKKKNELKDAQQEQQQPTTTEK